MSKNYAFIYSRYYPLGGGVANASKNFAEALVKDGNKVTMFTMLPGRSKLPRKEVINGVTVRRFKFPGKLVNAVSFGLPMIALHLKAYTIASKIFFKREKFDLILGHNIQWGGFFATKIGKINGIPSAGMAHGEDVNQLRGNPQKEKMTVYALKNLDYVFSTNEDFSNILASYYQRKILPLPNIFQAAERNSFDMDVVKKRYNDGSLKLIAIGRLDIFGREKTEIKGFSVALEAFKNLPETITLEIIGEGPLFSYYQDFIKKNQLQNQVFLRGLLPFEEVQKKLNSCSGVLLPSNIEGLSMVMLETMSKGLPLIATGIAGAKDYIVNEVNGLLIEPGDVEGLRKQILLLAKDLNFYKKLSFSSKNTYSQHFTEKAVLKKLYNHLNQ